MKKLLLCAISITTFVNLLVGNSVFAQQNKIDSLLHLLKKDKADTSKLIHLEEIAFQYGQLDKYSEGLTFCQQALAIADLILKNSTTAGKEQIKLSTKKHKANVNNTLGNIYDNTGDYDLALHHHTEALKIRSEIGDIPGLAGSYGNIGNIHDYKGDYQQALKNHFASLKLFESIHDQKGIATTYGNIGIIYCNQGNYPEALKNYFAALKIEETIGDKKLIAGSYNNIGRLYNYQKNYPEALKNHKASIKIREAIGDKKGISYSLNNIGSINYDQGNYPEALKNYFAALKIGEEIGNKAGVAAAYANLGLVFSSQGKYTEALAKFFASLKIREEMGSKAGAAECCGNIGTVFTEQRKFKEAEIYLTRAKDLSREIGHIEYLSEAYWTLSELDSLKGDYKAAYSNLKSYMFFRDSLDNEETRKNTIQNQMNYNFEKKEAVAKAEHKKELEKQHLLAEEKSRKQKAVIGFVGIGLLFVLVFASFIFRSLRVTRKQKHIIELQKNKVEEQKKEVEHQKLLVEEHQKEIVDSITYAKRIQYTLLANKQLLETNLPKHFVLFKPKDIVSGDFYWATEKRNSKFQNQGSNTQNLESGTCDRFYIAVCDSTGHGVPGAFLSLLNITFLNEAVNEKNIIEPHEILNHVRKRLIENMDGGQDGMDCILLCIENSNFENESNSPLKRGAGGIKITYAAANNSSIIQRNGTLISLNTDKMPVGKGESNSSFTLHSFEFEKGDSLYLFTDGYADQFGGSKGKKFKYKQLKELLVSVSNKPLAEQSEILDQQFEEWKGNLEQVDDMLLIGVRL